MPEDEATVRSSKQKRTPYEKGWWMWLTALVVCFIAMSLNLSTAHTPQPVLITLFFVTFVLSALLGVYSLLFFSKLPKAMTVLGLLQACLFGFNVLGRFGFAWLAKIGG